MLRITLTALIALGLGSAAAAAAPCTHETLTVLGTPVAVTYCVVAAGPVTPGHELPITVRESYRDASGTFTRERTLDFIAGEGPSRVIEDVPLGALHLNGTLHLTLLLRAGQVAIESAILTPGAVIIK
ncbi:MAG: hypothetical protein ACYDEU_08510 [Vulcanimicrobiaceae bacterium]